eukprot:10573-Heterococcus_DN1.PRE.2
MSTTDSSSPLQQAGVLQHVLAYVGPGHWCFVAEVSSLWRELYLKVAKRRVQIQCLARHRECYMHKLTGFAAPQNSTRALQAAIEGAAQRNALAVVQFLHAQGCFLSYEMFEAAAARGHTEMCAYLHAHGCPCDAAACKKAAINGHYSTLRWLHKHGCPWYETSIALAAAEGCSVDVMVYLQQQGIVRLSGDVQCAVILLQHALCWFGIEHAARRHSPKLEEVATDVCSVALFDCYTVVSLLDRTAVVSGRVPR